MFQNWGKGWVGYKPVYSKPSTINHQHRKKFTRYWENVKARDTFYFRYFRVEGLTRFKAAGVI